MIKARLLALLPYKFRHKVLKLNAYVSNPKLQRQWHKTFEVQSSPVLLLSLPRSGSSWLGEVLGQSKEVRYLREPITSIYMAAVKKPVSFFMPSQCKNKVIYDQAADNAFQARLNYVDRAIHSKQRWLNTHEPKKLLIKEINPLYLETFSKRYQPRVIYLDRCPYAIAKSFKALNWCASDLFSMRFERTIIDQLESVKADIRTCSFYFQMGFLQGVIKAIVETQLQLMTSIVVQYERLLLDTPAEIRRIAEFMNINDVEPIYEYIELSLKKSSSSELGDFSTKRNREELLTRLEQQRKEADYEVTIKAYELGYLEYKKLI